MQPSSCPPSWVVLMMWSLNSMHLSQKNGHGVSGCVIEPMTSPHVVHNTGSGQFRVWWFPVHLPHLTAWLLCVAVRRRWWSASLCCVSLMVISAVQSSKLFDQVAKPVQSSHDGSNVSWSRHIGGMPASLSRSSLEKSGWWWFVPLGCAGGPAMGGVAVPG